MKEIVTPKGVLKYRLPDISEGYTFLSYIDSIKNAAEVFIIKGRIIKNMGNFISYSELGYLSYDEVLNDKENMRDALSEISKDIFDDIIELLGKKI